MYHLWPDTFNESRRVDGHADATQPSPDRVRVNWSRTLQQSREQRTRDTFCDLWRSAFRCVCFHLSQQPAKHATPLSCCLLLCSYLLPIYPRLSFHLLCCFVFRQVRPTRLVCTPAPQRATHKQILIIQLAWAS